MAWTTRRPCARRSCRADVSRVLLPHRSRRSRRRNSAAVGLRSGQPAELFPLVEHARRGVVAACRGRRPARTGSDHGPGAAHVAGSADPGAGGRVRRQLARFSPISRKSAPSIGNVSRSSPTSCARRCSRNRFASSWTCFKPTVPSSTSVCQDTFVNPVLARHYGIPAAGSGADEWVRVEDADRYDRGGLLADGRVLDQERAGLADESGEARQLGGEEHPGRTHPAAAAGGARTAER